MLKQKFNTSKVKEILDPSRVTEKIHHELSTNYQEHLKPLKSSNKINTYKKHLIYLVVLSLIEFHKLNLLAILRI